MAEVSILREKIRAVLPDVRELRHQLHQIPEIALNEYKTSAEIRKYLEKLGLPILPTTLGTDVTAVLKGGLPGPTILLRADIDALPIVENTGASYSSRHPGFAHSCGHDGHTAILLGAATVLSELRDQVPGTVKFLFQLPGAGAGGDRGLRPPRLARGAGRGGRVLHRPHHGRNQRLRDNPYRSRRPWCNA